MNAYQFLDYASSDSIYSNHYLEIIIDNFGSIEPAIPCHSETLFRLMAKKYHLTREEYLESIPIMVSPLMYIISKENYISVWYNRILYYSINKFQQKTLDILVKNNLLDSNYDKIKTNEYQKFLLREKYENNEISSEEFNELCTKLLENTPINKG